MNYMSFTFAVVGLSSYLMCGHANAHNAVTECDDEHLYRIIIKETNKTLKEHLACMQLSGENIIFRSSMKPDYTFIPVKVVTSANSFNAGTYRAYVADNPVLYKNTPVQVQIAGNHYTISESDSLSIEAVKIHSSVLPTVSSWKSPFTEPSLPAYPSLASRVVSSFGADRTSFHIRHLHTGVDLEGKPSEAVYPIAEGIVEFVSYWDYEGTVVVRHRTLSGWTIMSKYVHITDVMVHPGDVVARNTIMAHLFTKEEFKKSGFKHLHLHLEIRKDYSDYGHASTHSFTKNDLYRCCIDPLILISR